MEEKILYLTASGQSLQNNTKQVFASNTVKYVGAIFSLDENWQSMDAVSAVWQAKGVAISTVLDHDGYASIPPEMLDKVAPVMVNLVGSVTENNELKERLTTFPILALRVTADALINGGETAPITPSQFEQYVAVVKNDADRAEQAVEDVEQIKADVIQLKEDTETLKEDTAQLKADTAEIKTEVETLAEDFDETVAQAKSEIETLSTTEQGAISTLSANKKAEITQEGTTQKNAVTAEGTAQKGAITSLATDKLNAITQEGNTQTQRVTAEGNTQVSNVQTEGTRQIGLVTAEGEAQVDEIQHIGAETIASIPKLAPVITDTANGSIASFTDGADDYPMKSVVAEIVPIQSGTGDPSPDNVRPISGWDEVGVEHTGKNLFDKSKATIGKYLNIQLQEVSNSAKAHSELIPVKPSTIYFMNGFGGAGYFAMLALDENKQPIVWYVGASKTAPFEATTPSNCHYMYLNFNADQIDTMAFYEGTDEGYIPYQGQSYSIPFKDSEDNPITVYGGVLDVVSGKLTIDRFFINDFSGLSKAMTSIAGGSKQLFIYNLPNPVKNINANVKSDKLACNTFKTLTADQLYSGNQGIASAFGRLYFYSSTLQTIEEWNEYLSNVQVVYELATPIEIQLTPTEVKTLLGANNVWADTGDTSVEYCADTGLYVNKLKDAIISLGGNI